MPQAIARAVRSRFPQTLDYESGRVWANARDVIRRAPSRRGRGRRAAVDIVVCLGRGEFFSVFFSDFVFLRTNTAYCKYEATFCLIYLFTSNEARPKERSDRGRFLPLGEKSLFIPGCVQGAIIEFVCRCVRVCNIRRFC